VSFFVNLDCKQVVVIVRIVISMLASLALSKLFAVFDSCDGLLPLTLFDQVFWRVGLRGGPGLFRVGRLTLCFGFGLAPCLGLAINIIILNLLS